MTDDEKLLAEVQAILDPYGCVATDLGPNAVGVQGDARVYLPTVFVTFPPGITMEQVAEISTRVTNLVKVARVLMNL